MAFRITCLFDPCFQTDIEKFGIFLFEAKFVEDGLDDFFASGMVENGQCFVFDICAKYASEYLDYHLRRSSLVKSALARQSDEH